MKHKNKNLIKIIAITLVLILLFIPFINKKKININSLSNGSNKSNDTKIKSTNIESNKENINEEKKIIEENESKNFEPKQTEEEENKNEKFDINGVKISLNGDEEIYLNKGDKYIEQGAKAYTKDNKDISSLIKIDGTVDTSKEGSYNITYYIGKAVVIRSVFVK